MNQVDVAVNAQAETVESNQINVASPAEYEVDYREKKGYEIVKRAFDIVASLCALTVLSPIFLITIIAIFLTDFYHIAKIIGNQAPNRRIPQHRFSKSC